MSSELRVRGGKREGERGGNEVWKVRVKETDKKIARGGGCWFKSRFRFE